ncbi:uncharacterized protein BYT42DRAFT_488593 [Radiomyces spectabilis]|uniref:uncharacterized protein n=1 Tax=Radiomyces spectabilis TaxID=64574 RepID=UPI00221FCEC6|nr:uncharacterized protein BYT42DRAFT_488593 [Radiomyces spectabilis]KAI8394199.1 hypothetical protein BYT42DRAFT_488593 [Radiomyces spectabilis]
MGDFLTAYLHGNSSVIRVQGSPYGPDDELGKRKLSSVPEWLRKALASIAIDIPFPGTNHTDLIQSLELENIKMDFSRSGNPLISGDAVAMLKKPEEMQFPMDVTQIHPTVFIYLRPDSEKPFARLAPEDPSPATTLDGDSADNDLPCGTMKVISKVHRAPFKVEPGGEKEFEQFLHKVFYGTRAKVYIRGVSDASVDSAFGHLVIKDLEFNGTIDTKGMEGMVDPPPAVSSMEIIKGYPDALHVQTQLMIESPADVNINLGALNILLLYKNEPIGNGSIAEFKLAPGRQNRLTCSVWLHGDDPHSRMNVVDFVGQYLGNDGNTSLTISGDHPNATQAPLLRAFFKQLRFVVQPPPFHESPLLKNVQMNILSSTTVMYLQNPFNGVQLEIVKLNASASYGIHEIGTVKANFADKGEGWDGPIVLPPPSCENSNCTEVVIETPKIPVVTKKLGMDAIKKALNGEITVSVDSNVTVNVDAFVLQDLKYKRDNITAKVRKGF